MNEKNYEVLFGLSSLGKEIGNVFDFCDEIVINDDDCKKLKIMISNTLMTAMEYVDKVDAVEMETNKAVWVDEPFMD